jgi:hypothetical protein
MNQQDPTQQGSQSVKAAHEGLPDTQHLSGLCPQCGKQSTFELRCTQAVTHETKYAYGIDGQATAIDLQRVVLLQCRHCTQRTVVIEERVQGSSVGIRPTLTPVFYRGIHWWPLPQTQMSSTIPEAIARTFTEATRALYAECPQAVVIMARRTLEAITDDQGITSGNLAQRLATLATNGTLHPILAEMAREVRMIGNNGAHYDPIHPVSLDDARDLMNFLRELLHYLYEMPAELQRRRTTP